MAQRFYRIDLQDRVFPMLSEQQGRTVIGSTAGEAPSKDNQPGVAYCHNVMPSSYGFDSVGFLNVVPAFPLIPAGGVFSDVRIAYGDAKTRLYLAWDSFGNVYSLLTGSTAWIAVPSVSPFPPGGSFTGDLVTIGTVNGVSYIFYAGIGAFNYNEVTNVLDAVTLTGLTIADVLGVVASSGYLIAYTSQAIAWSSTIDPKDFVPSTVTGAGGGNVAGIAGAILFCASNTLGVIIYTLANAIAGTYTGNTQFPFKFREIEDSKGGINLDRIAYEANSRAQFVYSKAGIQELTSQRAKTILPEVTDFLAGKRFEDFNETTKLYEITTLLATETMSKKMKYVASRYLVISYGLPSTGFTHALVFDTSLGKLGKLRITHVDVFEYVGAQTEIAKESLAFVLSTGEVKVVDFSTKSTSSGVLILGKLQATRSRLTGLLGVEVENIPTSFPLTLDSQTSLDGKTFTTVAGTARTTVDNLREYFFRASAKSHSLVLIGAFNAVTVQIRYKVEGRR